MPRFLCCICRYTTPMTALVANVLTHYLHCMHGVPGAPYRTECMVLCASRAPTTSADVRLRGQMSTRYPVFTAS